MEASVLNTMEKYSAAAWNTYERQKKIKNVKKCHFSRRSMALDHALDNELERHLVLERKRLGVS